MGARPPRVSAALAAALAAGVALRSFLFLHRSSLSMDEARLALNIGARGFGDLIAPLDLDQSAPLLFLWAERLVTLAFGVHELSLRLLPLVAGVVVLLLSVAVLRRLVTDRSVVLGLAILAAAPTMVTYSSEAKQYMVEALVALALTWLALEWLDRPEGRVARVLAVAGAGAVWLSGSAILVLAGIAPALLWTRRPVDTSHRRAAAAACVAWAVSFGFAYLVVYRPASANPYMARYWSPAFLIPGASASHNAWLAVKDVVWGFLVGHDGLARRAEAEVFVSVCALVGLACVSLGAWRLRRHRGMSVAVILLGPLAATLLASALGLYPVGQRLLLFAVPSIVILGVAGLEAATERLAGAWSRRAWWVVAGLVVTPPLAVTVLQITVLDSSSRMRELVARLSIHRAAGEPVYVFSRALPAWGFYVTNWSAPDRSRLAFLNRVGQAGGPAFENAPSRRGPVASGEGAELVYRSTKGLELIGIPTGMEYASGTGLLRLRPDDGWAHREGDRIRHAATPGIWIVLAEFLGPEYELVDELKRRGGRMTYGSLEPGHVLVRFVFDSNQPSTLRP
jgi:hypothetical protein